MTHHQDIEGRGKINEKQTNPKRPAGQGAVRANGSDCPAKGQESGTGRHYKVFVRRREHRDLKIWIEDKRVVGHDDEVDRSGIELVDDHRNKIGVNRWKLRQERQKDGLDRKRNRRTATVAGNAFGAFVGPKRAQRP